MSENRLWLIRAWVDCITDAVLQDDPRPAGILMEAAAELGKFMTVEEMSDAENALGRSIVSVTWEQIRSWQDEQRWYEGS